MFKYRLRLLGPVKITYETDAPPRIRSQRTIALLGYLAAERRPVARQTLAALFWPDKPPATRRANLRRELDNLRHLLPGCWEIDHNLAAFTPGAETSVDLEALQNLEAQGGWLQAAEVVRGEFLEGLYLDNNPEFESWLLSERERWRQRAEQLLLQAAQVERQQGHYPQARRYLARLLKLVPWHEEGHGQMMRLLAHSGQFSAALKQYEQCRNILATELDVTPSVATTILYERIKAAMALPAHNLPPQATPFVGREEEVAVLRRRLASPDCRLLTLTGVGGIGKSRLALEVARLLSSEDFRLFLHGVAYVPLSGVDRQDFIPAVGAGLRIAFSGQKPAERQLLTYLHDMELLLVLDNYEHLLPETILLATILREAPLVKLLVTSRERLSLQEEWLFEVDGLPYPEQELVNLPGEDESEYAAVRLFAANARRVYRTDLLVTSRREVASICRLVQGMPLALELAGARLQSLTPGDVLVELEHGLDILATEMQNMPSRHTSLRAVFDASWAGLSGQEQKVLSQLSLFRGGFTLEAAFKVAGGTASVLNSLSNKSLIRLMPSGRYEMHELLRQYAAEKLAANVALDAASREGYVAYYGVFLEQREQRLLETNQAETLRELDAEIDNLRHAWRWAVERNQLSFLDQALWTLAFFYELRSWFPEALDLMESTLRRLSSLNAENFPHARLLALLRLFQSYFLLRRGRPKESQAVLEPVLPRLRDLGDERDLAFARFIWGHVRVDLDDIEGAIAALEEGAAICRAVGLQWLEAFLDARAAFYLAMRDRQVQGEARQLSNRALAISQQLDTPWVLTFTNITCSRLAMFQGEYGNAERMDQSALEAARRIGYLWGIGLALFYLGLDKYLQEEAEASWGYYEESRQFVHRSGERELDAMLDSATGELARFQGDYNKACRLFRQSIEICTESGFTNLAATVYCMYGHALLRQTSWRDAGSYFIQSLSMPGSRAGPTGAMTSLNLAGLAGVLAALEKPYAAGQLLGAAEAQLVTAPRPLWPADRQDWERILAQIKDQLDEEMFLSAREAGQALSLDEAVALALNSIQQPKPSEAR